MKINGKWIKEDYVLCEGDVLRIYIKEDFRKEKEVKECELTAPIIFEDENIIIFNKPAELPCQPDEKHKSGTLSDMLKRPHLLECLLPQFRELVKTIHP